MRLRNLLAVLLLAAPGAAVEPSAGFRQLSLEQGLSQAVVQALVQDDEGFLWIGTQDGLNRFDGYGFTVLRNDPDDAWSLPDNNIFSLAIGRGGVLWVGAVDRGLARLDLGSLRATRFAPDPSRPDALPAASVTALLEDRAGRLWAGTAGGGLAILPKGGSSFTVLAPDPKDPSSFPSAFVPALAEDPSGDIWAATIGAGILRLDPRTGRVRERIGGERGDGPRGSGCLLVDRAGNLWAGVPGGFLRRDGRTGELRSFRNDPADAGSFPARQVRHLGEDTSGRIWIATEAGLVAFDPASGSFLRVRNDPLDATSLPNDRVTVALPDRSGLLWTGSDGSGLAFFDLLPSPFRTYRQQPGQRDGLTGRLVRSVHEDFDGTLWLGFVAGGLSALDLRTGTVRAFRAAPGDARGLSNGDVFAVVRDDEGIVWAGTFGGGLNRIDPRTGLVRAFRASPSDPTALPTDALRIVHLGCDGYLWLGTHGGGLARFDRQTGSVLRFQNDPADPRSLSSNVVRAVHEGLSGALWIGTDGGIDRLDRTTGTVTRFLSDPTRPETAGVVRVYGLYEDRRGLVWAGTPRGLVRLDPATGEVLRYRERDGLPNDTVYSVVPDDTGTLWLSTNRGLARVGLSASGEPSSIRGFDARDGLQSDEFNGGAFDRGPTGTLWFGGILGVTGVRPAEVRDDPFPPQVALTSFARFGQPVTTASWKPRGTVTLRHDQGFFSIEFAALAFRAAAKNVYAWKLEGLDPAWVVGGSRRRADYTAVPSGDYLFRVKAANKDGVWSEKGAELRIVVLPPWWRSRRAFVLWLTLAAAGVWAGDRVQRHRLLTKERGRSQLVEAELRARAAEAQARAVAAESERKTAELDEARSLQLALLPREVPEVPGLSLAALSRTATEVGGDTYDFAVGPDGALAVVVGDATGHGVTAGMVVSVMKGLFRRDPFPADLGGFLDQSGHVLFDLGLPRLHMALAVLVVRGDQATLASAGMPPAFVHRAATGEVEEILVPGAPLGALLAVPHRSVTFRLDPGDFVLLASDGLAESPGLSGDPLGYTRAKELFREVAGLPPREAVEAMARKEDEWRGELPRADDLTLVVLRREGVSAAPAPPAPR